MKILNYDLIRSKRKTIAIVIKDGSVTIKAPSKTQISYIEAFVQSKHSWIDSKLNEYKALNAENTKYINYESFSFFGEDYSPQITSTKKKYIFG